MIKQKTPPLKRWDINFNCPLRTICHRAKEKRVLMIQNKKYFNFSEKKGCDNLVFD
jgi:hypothetical protein